MVRLTFLGTKGEIEEFTDRHMYHSSLLVESGDARILIDYGKLRKYSLEDLRPDALLITHAHPDHYAWLDENLATDIPVYLTRESLEYGKFRPRGAILIEPGTTFVLGPFHVLPYGVLHSTRCPAVGYKLEAEGKTFVYNPDLVDMEDKDRVLPGTDLYIGDGSSIKANLVRRYQSEQIDTVIGHARITTQLNWCRKFGVHRPVFTHLGKETISMESRFLEDHPDVVLAYDGMQIEV